MVCLIEAYLAPRPLPQGEVRWLCHGACLHRLSPSVAAPQHRCARALRVSVHGGGSSGELRQ